MRAPLEKGPGLRGARFIGTGSLARPSGCFCPSGEPERHARHPFIETGRAEIRPTEIRTGEVRTREIRIDEPRLIEVQLQEVYLNSAEYMGGSTVQLIEIRPR